MTTSSLPPEAAQALADMQNATGVKATRPDPDPDDGSGDQAPKLAPDVAAALDQMRHSGGRTQTPHSTGATR